MLFEEAENLISFIVGVFCRGFVGGHFKGHNLLNHWFLNNQ